VSEETVSVPLVEEEPSHYWHGLKPYVMIPFSETMRQYEKAMRDTPISEIPSLLFPTPESTEQENNAQDPELDQ
jgi:hypothetical protein